MRVTCGKAVSEVRLKSALFVIQSLVRISHHSTLRHVMTEALSRSPMFVLAESQQASCERIEETTSAQGLVSTT